MKLNTPGAVGTPSSSPVWPPPGIDTESPGGRSPKTRFQPSYGVTPPSAARTCEYGTPAVPAGSDDALVMERPAVATVNAAAFETAPPGFSTRTLAAPWFVIRPAGTDAVNWLPFT